MGRYSGIDLDHTPVFRFEIDLNCPHCHHPSILYTFSAQSTVWLDCPRCYWCGYPVNYLLDHFGGSVELINDSILKIRNLHPISDNQLKVINQTISFFRRNKRLSIIANRKNFTPITEDWLDHNPPYWWYLSKDEFQKAHIQLNLSVDRSSRYGLVTIPSYDSLGRILSIDLYQYQPLDGPKFVSRVVKFDSYKGLKFRPPGIASNPILDQSVITTNINFAISTINHCCRMQIYPPKIYCISGLSVREIKNIVLDTQSENSIVICQKDIPLIEKAVIYGLCSRNDFKIFYPSSSTSMSGILDTKDSKDVYLSILENICDKSKSWQQALLEDISNLDHKVASVLLESLDKNFIKDKVSKIWSRQHIYQYLSDVSKVPELVFKLDNNWHICVSASKLIHKETSSTVCPFVPSVKLCHDGETLQWDILYKGKIYTLSTRPGSNHIEQIEQHLIRNGIFDLESTHPFIATHLYSIARYIHSSRLANMKNAD